MISDRGALVRLNNAPMRQRKKRRRSSCATALGEEGKRCVVGKTDGGQRPREIESDGESLASGRGKGE